MTAVFYNEIDPYPAQWLRNLIAEGHLADGVVDERSISDLRPEDIGGYVQANFFAGIGGWPLALALAGWPEDRPVWTGSCPCQPFSAAGKRKGVQDSRDLWPAFRDLIAQCRPPTIFGEQVASADGRWWLARVRADLEALGYAVGAADLCAASVGAPHIRQRLFWVADASSQRRQQIARSPSSDEGAYGRQSGANHIASGNGADGGLAESQIKQLNGSGDAGGGWRQFPDRSGLGNADDTRPQGHGQPRERTDQRSAWETSDLSGMGISNGTGRQPWRQASQTPRHWDSFVTTSCLDGKARRIGTGVQPLAYGVPARVGQLRAYGNAIVPQVAAEFVRAFM